MRTKWERYAAVGGLWFVVLGVIGALIQGTPPDPDASAAKVVEYLNDNEGGVKVGALLFALASIGLLWWAGSLFRMLAEAEGGRPRLAVVSLLGLLWSGVFYLGSMALVAAMAQRVDTVGDPAGILYALSGVLAATASVGNIVHVVSASVVGLRARLFPAWVPYVGFVAAAAFAVGLLGICDDAKAFMVIGGLLGFLVWCVWLLAVSWTIWKQPAEG